MPERTLLRRCYLTGLLLMVAWAGMASLSSESNVPPVRPLQQFPRQLGGWQSSVQPLAPNILQALHLSDYLNRVYFAPGGAAVGLYIAYYPRQEFGDDIHSPKNCLPGSGWQPLQSGALAIDLAGRRVQVNRYLVARGPDRELILYWFQQQGRVVRSEYWSKGYQIWDGLTQHRSDAALVRIAVPIDSQPELAQTRGVDFIRLVFPDLPAYLPN